MASSTASAILSRDFRVGERFLGFATAVLAACFSAYAIIALYYWHIPLVAPIVSEFVMTMLFYAPITYLIAILHHRMVGPLRSDF